MQILPFYLVCDESGSMAGPSIDSINSALPELHKEISTNPTVADKTRFCLIGFSDDATVLQSLADLSDLDTLPALSAGGLTAYGEAFRTLLRCIETDVAALKAQGHDVYRPVAFFLSDGGPTDEDWIQAHQDLIQARYRPNIIAFGIGEADRATIGHVANFRAFIQEDKNVSPAAALREFAASLTRSIVRSASSIAANGNDTFNLVIDETVPGFMTVPLDKL
ncbi:VWA domain-containing protein [Streptomyces sp. Isolate_45]|uniref:vWA domain-containing protein n=1 Tax=unclassified Streptomyces TaxID=2593676 RepID=UPI002481AD1B|nr:VWA domain-containing protein [Streptomyces sp. Isolate_45]MDA5278980.1 VWA domain-containing protein [Streptomyces sp. Isolate_45]